MRKAIKYITTRIYKPLLVKYLSTTRAYTYKGIHLIVPPEVFHPGFFFSTKLLLRHISYLPLKQKTFLELGAGSGLISIYAAKKGAEITATDINPVAIESLQKNKALNNVLLRIIPSDLFDSIPLQAFDIIAINPPYYRGQPLSYADYAWYCGENGEYFTKLFSQLGNYVHPASDIWMVLCDGCDMEMIKNIAARYQWKMDDVSVKKTLLEINFIIKIERR